MRPAVLSWPGFHSAEPERPDFCALERIAAALGEPRTISYGIRCSLMLSLYNAAKAMGTQPLFQR
jgi:hypothetical protein